MAKTPVTVHWFRRDLRLDDNRGFAVALRSASKGSDGSRVLPLFIFDRDILKRLEDSDDARVGFIHQTLSDIQSELRAAGSDILCLIGEPLAIWKRLLAGDEKVLGPLTNQIEIMSVTVNGDYEPSARERDSAVETLLLKNGVKFSSFKDQVIFEKSEVTKDDGKPYTVFTPFSKKWLSTLEQAEADGLSPTRADRTRAHFSSLLEFTHLMPTLADLGFKPNRTIQIPSAKLETQSERLKTYAERRGFPAIEGTSRLGLHLRFGTVSIRKLVTRAREIGARVWLSELIWREFFMQILWHFPHVAEFAFRPEYEQIRWRNDETEFQLWCEGRTGYPLVDAGMRELNATGFMHNRVRMVTASFLVKHLLIDWRWGEAYFARRLLDFDLAANNGNWQWVAGSGCDAAPYFRVFNPELQLKRFDPKHEYVRHWVPEFGTPNQLAPIVDHAEARARVLRVYAVVKQKTE